MNTIILSTRKYKIKKDENYTIPSKGLIESWRLVDCINFIPILYINGKIIKFKRENKNIISIPELRNYIRNIDSEDENFILLDNLENVMYHEQLYALEYYQSLSNNDMFNSLFTKNLNIQLSFGDYGPDEVEIEETYWDRTTK